MSHLASTVESQSTQDYDLAVGHISTAAVTRGEGILITAATLELGHVGTTWVTRGHDVVQGALPVGDIATTALTRGVSLSANLTSTDIGHIVGPKVVRGSDIPLTDWTVSADFESGTLADFFDEAVGSTASLSSARSHGGAQALLIHQVGSASSCKLQVGAGITTLVGRFWVNLDVTPGATLQLLNIELLPSGSAVFRVTTSGVIQAGFGGSYQSGGTLSLDTWHSVDFRITIDGTAWTIDWYVDDAAKTQATLTGTASTFDIAKFASSGATTIDYWIDDIQLTNQTAVFPLDDLDAGVRYDLPIGHVSTPSAVRGVSNTAAAPAAVGHVPSPAAVRGADVPNDFIIQTSWESGTAGDVFDRVDGANTIITTVEQHTGAKCLRSQNTGDVSEMDLPAGLTTLVGRVWVMCGSSDTGGDIGYFARFRIGSVWCSLYFQGQRIRCSFSGGTERFSDVVNIAGWRAVDFRITTAGLGFFRCEWKVDGVTQTNASLAAQPDTDITYLRTGGFDPAAAGLGTYYQDDLQLVDDFAAYPLDDFVLNSAYTVAVGKVASPKATRGVSVPGGVFYSTGYETEPTVATAFDVLQGASASFATDQVKRGGRSLKLHQTSGAQPSERDLPDGLGVLVARLWVRVANLPVSTVQIANWNIGGGSGLALRLSSSGTIAVGFSGGSYSGGGTLPLNQWVAIDLRIDVRTATYTCDWKIDGVAKTAGSFVDPDGASTITSFKVSNTSAGTTWDAWIDDVQFSDTYTDFPLTDAADANTMPVGKVASAKAPHGIELPVPGAMPVGHITSPKAVRGQTVSVAVRPDAPLVRVNYQNTPRFELASTGERILLRGYNTILTTSDTGFAFVVDEMEAVGATAHRQVLNWNTLEPSAPLGDGDSSFAGDFTDNGGSPASGPSAGITFPAVGWTSANKEQGRIDAICRIGDVVYIGGYITEVNDAGTVTTNRDYLVAMDAITGTLISGFNPQPNGRIYGLAAGPSGSLLVGGDFTTIGGASRSRLAFLDPVTGSALSCTTPAFNGAVWGIDVDGTDVLVSGEFTNIGGTRAALLTVPSNPASGGSCTVDSGFTPNLSGGRCGSIRFAGTKAIVGGMFTTVNGDGSKAYVTAVKLSDGTAATWAGGWNGAAAAPCYRLSEVTGDTIYAAIGGGGGRVNKYTVSTGAIQWFFGCDGDCQAIGLSGDKVIVGFHGNFVAQSLNTLIGDNPSPISRHKCFALNSAGALQSFNPNFTSTQGVLGVWAIHGSYGKLYIGGDFTKVGGNLRERFGSFSDTGAGTGGPITDFSNLTHELDAATLDKIDQRAQMCADRGIYIQMDFHQANWSPYFGGSGVPSWYYTDSRFKGGAYAAGSGSVDKSTAIKNWWTGPEASMAQDLYISFVEAFIDWMKDKPWYPWVFGYSVFNEPNIGNLTGTNQAKTSAAHAWLAPVVDAIHAADPDRIKFLMCRGGGQGWGSATFLEFGNLQQKNIAFEYHEYYTGLSPGYPASGAGQVGYSASGDDYFPDSATVHNTTLGSSYHGNQDAQEAFLSVPVAKAQSKGVPLFVGEFGVHFDDPGRLNYALHTQRAFDRLLLSGCVWKAGTQTTDDLGILATTTDWNDVGDSWQAWIDATDLVIDAPTSGSALQLPVARIENRSRPPFAIKLGTSQQTLGGQDLVALGVKLGRRFVGLRQNNGPEVASFGTANTRYDQFGERIYYRVIQLDGDGDYAKVTSGQYDTQLDAIFTSVKASRYTNPGATMYLAISHEMSFHPNAGTSQEYIDCFRYIVNRADVQAVSRFSKTGQYLGGPVVWCFAGNNRMFVDAAGNEPPDAGDEMAAWDPDNGTSGAPTGTTYYTLVGSSLYNDLDTPGTGQYKFNDDAATLLQPIIDYAESVGKKWFLGEWGYADGNTQAHHDRKAAIVDEFHTTVAARVGNAPGDCEFLMSTMKLSDSNYNADSSPESLAAFSDLAQDPAFSGGLGPATYGIAEPAVQTGDLVVDQVSRAPAARGASFAAVSATLAVGKIATGKAVRGVTDGRATSVTLGHVDSDKDVRGIGSTAFSAMRAYTVRPYQKTTIIRLSTPTLEEQ